MGLSSEYPPGQRGSSPEELALLLKKEEQAPHYEGGWIPIDAINVLPQPRQTFEAIKELAEDIADKGLMTPLIVARFSGESCDDYIKVIGSLWQAGLKIEDLVGRAEDREEFFYILIAGERRFRAFRHLESEGCGEDHGGGNCFESHFPDRLVEVRLCVDIPPLQAILLQASENIHMRVPPHEEARFYYNLLKILREVDEKYSLAAFARKVGRSPSYIRNAVKFCELPLNIQRLVEQRDLVYGKALEITRLIDTGVDEDNLGWVIKSAMVQGRTVGEFREWVTKYLIDLKSGQTMFEVCTEVSEEEMRKSSIRRTVAKEMIKSIWERITYFRLVGKLISEGKLGKDESPFSIGSPIRVYLANIAELEQLLPLLRENLAEQKARRAKEILADAKEVFEELEPLLPPGDKDLDPYSEVSAQGSSPPVDRG